MWLFLCAILENGERFKSVPNCNKFTEMFNKAINNYPHTLEFVPECYKIQKVCDKAVDTHPTAIKYVPKCYNTREMCYTAVHRCFFYLILFLINIKLKKYVT